MSVELEAFDLSIFWQTSGNDNGPHPGRLWLSASSRLGSVHGVPRDLDAPIVAALGAAAQRFGDSVHLAQPEPAWAPEIAGQLTDLVFGVPELQSLFHRSRGAAMERGRQLLLRVQATPGAAANVPWELFADPDQPTVPAGADAAAAGPPGFLMFAPDVHVVRTPRARTYPVPTEPVVPPLHVLLVLSNPETSSTDEVPFDLFEERRALLAELQPLEDRGALVVDIEDNPTVENLRRRIAARARGYHVVHYLGHANPTRLKLEDAERRPRWVDGEHFNAVLRDCPDLRLVFYAGCRTAAQPEGDGAWPEVLSLADRTVRDSCSMVVGMQAELPFRTEQLLTHFFYRALVSGQSVAQALKTARAAVRDDDLVGGDLLDWVVPSLFTSALPERIIDPAAPTTPPRSTKRPRVSLRFNLAEPDREFFARQFEMRRLLDMLSRRQGPRVQWVVGPPGAGKTRLVARALDELDDVSADLYLPISRLVRPGRGGTAADGRPPSPLDRLCELVVELLARCDVTARTREEGWDALDWWDRLIEDLTGSSVVVVLDGLDDLEAVPGPEVRELGDALSRLVQRRTLARLALVAMASRPGLLTPEAEQFAGTDLTVNPLGFNDVWQWIRRNRPGLVRYGFDRLVAHYARLTTLESWSELARILAAAPLMPLDEAVARIAPAPPPVVTPTWPDPGPGGIEERGISVTAPPALPPSHRPLRVAAAGPFLVGHEADFAASVTALASTHGVGGRVVAQSTPDTSGSMAELLPVPSPFVDGAGTTAGILTWLETVVEKGADIVLLDFGGPSSDVVTQQALTDLAALGAVIVAAGGNDKAPVWPAWYTEALAVGALERSEPEGAGWELAPYSFWDPAAAKPDLFTQGDVAGTTFEKFLPPKFRGSSAAAINAVGAVVVVWAADRSMTAPDVCAVLRDSAAPLTAPQPGATAAAGPRRLDLVAAVGLVRERVVQRALGARPLNRDAIVAVTGLRTNEVDQVLQRLQDAGKVETRVAPDGVRYSLRASDQGGGSTGEGE